MPHALVTGEVTENMQNHRNFKVLPAIGNCDINSVRLNNLEVLSIAQEEMDCVVSSVSDPDTNSGYNERSHDNLKQDRKNIVRPEVCVDDLPRRSRTTFSSTQIFFLEKEYNNDQYLSKSKRAELSKELNLLESTIKIWFQNRRMKDKRRRMPISWSYGLPPSQPITVAVPGAQVLVPPACGYCPLPLTSYPATYCNYPVQPPQHCIPQYPMYAPSLFPLQPESRIPQHSSCSPTSTSEVYTPVRSSSSPGSISPQIVSTTTATPSPERQTYQLGPCLCYMCVGGRVPETTFSNEHSQATDLTVKNKLQTRQKSTLFRPYEIDG